MINLQEFIKELTPILEDSRNLKYGIHGIEIKLIVRGQPGQVGKLYDIGSQSIVLGLDPDNQKVIDIADIHGAFLILPERHEPFPLIEGKTDFEAMKEALDHIYEDDDAGQTLPGKEAARVLKRFKKE